MIKIVSVTIVSALVLSTLNSNVNAGPFSDALAKCLVRSATPSDNVKLIRWMFFAMSEHPSLKSASKVTEWDKAENDKEMADLWTHLLTVSCRQETREAMKHEKRTALHAASRIFGGSAMKEIMRNTKVKKRIANFSKFLDKNKMRRLGIK
jgi:hypothetical protein